MKILLIALLVIGCKKKDSPIPSLPNYKTFTYEQALDSMGIKEGKMYLWLSNASKDTVTFNSDQTVTENSFTVKIGFEVKAYQIITSANPKDSSLIYRIFTVGDSAYKTHNFLAFAHDTLVIQLTSIKSDTITASGHSLYPIN